MWVWEAGLSNRGGGWGAGPLGEWDRMEGSCRVYCWFITSYKGFGTGLGLAGAGLMANGPGQTADSLGFIPG